VECSPWLTGTSLAGQTAPAIQVLSSGAVVLLLNTTWHTHLTPVFVYQLLGQILKLDEVIATTGLVVTDLVDLLQHQDAAGSAGNQGVAPIMLANLSTARVLDSTSGPSDRPKAWLQLEQGVLKLGPVGRMHAISQ